MGRAKAEGRSRQEAPRHLAAESDDDRRDSEAARPSASTETKALAVAVRGGTQCSEWAQRRMGSGLQGAISARQPAVLLPADSIGLTSRSILAIEALDGTDEEQARAVFEEAFATYGLPVVIRTDNGTPFASAAALAGLTRLSAYWLRLGIRHERTEPAHPEQNGCHERMHRTLKAETARPARSNLLQQQERFDEFRRQFNEERPHEALEMKRPMEVYRPSERRLPQPLPELAYPLHDDVLIVGRGGHVRLPERPSNLPVVRPRAPGSRATRRDRWALARDLRVARPWTLQSARWKL